MFSKVDLKRKIQNKIYQKVLEQSVRVKLLLQHSLATDNIRTQTQLNIRL